MPTNWIAIAFLALFVILVFLKDKVRERNIKNRNSHTELEQLLEVGYIASLATALIIGVSSFEH